MLELIKNSKTKIYYYMVFATLFLSLLYSPSLLVISMLLLVIPPLFAFRKKKPFIIVFPGLKEKLKHFFQSKAFFVLTLIFWITLFTFFSSTDKESWQFFIIMKLPFLLLPFAFLHLPYFSKKEYYGIFSMFIIIILISSVGVLYNILTDADDILLNIRKGKAVETPIEHIKYSLLVSFASMLGIIMFFDVKNYFFKYEKIILGLIVLFLILFIHLLAVRSGLFILYINLFIYLAIEMIKRRKYLWGVLLALLLMTLPVIAYQSIPTFKEKIQYMLLDFKMSQDNKGGAFSDGERIRSYEVGWELLESSPITGIGYGDIFREYNDLYEVKYFVKSPTNLPHNQFLTIAVTSGLIGFILFCIAFFFPFFFNNAWENPFLMAFQVLIFLSFMVENTLERQNGVGFYLIFLLLLLHAHSNGFGNEKSLKAES